MTLNIPSNIRLMADILKGKTPDTTRIELQVRKFSAEIQKAGGKRDARQIAAEIIALWKQNEVRKAIELGNQLLRKDPNNHVILSLVGRSLMKIKPPDPQAAEEHLKKAYNLGNTRTETLNDWFIAKQMQNDWRGLASLAKRLRGDLSTGFVVKIEATALVRMGQNRSSERDHRAAAEKYLEAGRLIQQELQAGSCHGHAGESDRA